PVVGELAQLRAVGHRVGRIQRLRTRRREPHRRTERRGERHLEQKQDEEKTARRAHPPPPPRARSYHGRDGRASESGVAPLPRPRPCRLTSSRRMVENRQEARRIIGELARTVDRKLRSEEHTSELQSLRHL